MSEETPKKPEIEIFEDLKKEIHLKKDTWWTILGGILGLLGLVAFLVSIPMTIFGQVPWYAIPAALGVFLLLAFLALSTYSLMVVEKLTGNIYEKNHFLIFSWGGKKSHINELFCLSLQARKRGNKYRIWWSYQAVLVPKEGKLIPFSNEFGESQRPELLEQVRKLSNNLRLDLVELEPRVGLSTLQQNLRAKEDLQLLDESELNSRFWQPYLIFGVLVVLGILLLIFMGPSFFGV